MLCPKSYTQQWQSQSRRQWDQYGGYRSSRERVMLGKAPTNAYKCPASGAFIDGSTNLPDWIGYIVDICQVVMLQPISIKIATIVINLKSLWGHEGGLS